MWGERRRRVLFYRWSAAAVLVAAVAAFGLLYPLPYFIMAPGSAIDLEGVVHVEDAFHDEVGSFVMTTVQADQATPFTLLISGFVPEREIVQANAVLPPYEDAEHYFARQRAVMEASQQVALIVAFRKANLPIDVEEVGALVTTTIPGTPAARALRSGDVITAVDGRPTPTAEALIQALGRKKIGDAVRVTVRRDDHVQVLSLTVDRLPQAPGVPERSGIGLLQPLTAREVHPSLTVTFDLDQIGGPSAGLMMTLAILNRLVPGDLTHGHRISGTGTIDVDGRVGRVGGVELKAIAAARAHAEYFLVPDDDPPPGKRSNYDEARQANARFRLGLNIVPVKTIDDALAFLSALR